MKRFAVVAGLFATLLIAGAVTGFFFHSANTGRSGRNANRAPSGKPSPAQPLGAAASLQPANAAAQPSQPEQAASENAAVPAALVESVNANFSGYRIPAAADIKDAWAGKEAGASPFLAQGDFDGDGRNDAAVIIIGDSDWKLVIFEQDEQQHYAPAAVFRAKTVEEAPLYARYNVIAAPQHLILKSMRKGETWVVEGGDVSNDFALKLDSIELVYQPKPDFIDKSLILFADGKYQPQWEDSFVQVR
jgi:hypothetical protein